jgi:hypothetical protein
MLASKKCAGETGWDQEPSQSQTELPFRNQPGRFSGLRARHPRPREGAYKHESDERQAAFAQ